MSVKFFFRRYRRRKNQNSFFEQIASFTRRGDAANSASGHLVIMNAPRLLGKALANILGPPCHGHQGLVQLRHA